MFNSYIEGKNDHEDYNHRVVHGDAPGGDHHDFMVMMMVNVNVKNIITCSR